MRQGLEFFSIWNSCLNSLISFSPFGQPARSFHGTLFVSGKRSKGFGGAGKLGALAVIRAERNKCSLLNPQKPLNNHQRINKNIAAIIVGHTLRQKDWLTMISPLKKLKFIRITELVTNVGTDKHFKRKFLKSNRACSLWLLIPGSPKICFDEHNKILHHLGVDYAYLLEHLQANHRWFFHMQAPLGLFAGSSLICFFLDHQKFASGTSSKMGIGNNEGRLATMTTD
ncbi:hypothetical protein WN943_007167 [Citrus x changshan-huyou]